MSYLDNLFSLDSRVAIVTGGARGNGKAIAEALLRAGATVIVVDVLKELLFETTESFKSEGLDAIEYHCDISDTSNVIDLVQFVMGKCGKIDILVNNAGVTYSHSLIDYPDDYWDKTYKVDLKAPFELSRSVAKYMIEQRSGAIINITSLNAELAFPDNPAYVSFKGALKQLSKSLALDLGEYGVRVNTVGPGYFKTDMTIKSWQDTDSRKQRSQRTILGRWGQPDDLAGVIIFLASDASSYITGQDIYVDGGWLIKGL